MSTPALVETRAVVGKDSLRGSGGAVGASTTGGISSSLSCRSCRAPGQKIVDATVGDWRDTVVVPVGGKVTLRMNLTDFTGIFPFHCHVTAHQDLGMMMFVQIVNGSCQ